jgi:hypothetical protein
LFAIKQETQRARTPVFAFTAEFLPKFEPLYLIQDEPREVLIFYLQPTP